ncbi:hypothetical protein EVG20_g10173 [Dentipellis fragilis]|uniref:F-box domain-containing protein n=1 Tax=Dentipellis fragilis TaxID=205917 RepID=A0A4Y9XTD7_9AGAM|nr:hypothetical protein EVG20_g10173 [Dentipellis fragilis]
MTDAKRAPTTAGNFLLQFSLDGMSTETGEAFIELRNVRFLLPLDRLEFLQICGGFTCRTARNWATLLGGCDRVCHLEFISFCEPALWKALIMQTPAAGQSKSLFPALVSVAFEDVDFMHLNVNLHKRILKWLRIRQRHAPLKKIYLQQCQIDEETREGIEHEGLEVIWDGMSEFPEEEVDEDEEMFSDEEDDFTDSDSELRGKYIGVY